MEKNIKDYREKELKSFIYLNILLVLHGIGFFSSIGQSLDENNILDATRLLFDSSILSAIMYLFIFILDSLIPAVKKDKLIWIITGVPGNTIFIDIKKNNRDVRFTTESALMTYAN